MKNHSVCSSEKSRAWIYIRKQHTSDPYFDSLERKLRAYAASEGLSVTGISIDFNCRRSGHGISQMLQAASYKEFDVLVVNSLDQLSDNLLSVFDLMASLDGKGIKICAPGRGSFDYKKMKSDYDMDRIMDAIEERRAARERAECYLGDCEPEDYDYDYEPDYDPDAWEKKRGAGCWERR